MNSDWGVSCKLWVVNSELCTWIKYIWTKKCKKQQWTVIASIVTLGWWELTIFLHKTKSGNLTLIPPHIHLGNQSWNVTHLYLIPHQRKEEVQDHIVSSSESEVVYSSVEEATEEDEDIYLILVWWRRRQILLDPRLELIDRQFNLKMKETVLPGHPVNNPCPTMSKPPYTTQLTDMLTYIWQSPIPLTWVNQVKISSPEEDELSNLDVHHEE